MSDGLYSFRLAFILFQSLLFILFTGIGMALFSYKDRLRVTFIGDRASLPGANDVEFLRSGFESELTELSKSLGIEEDKLFISSKADI